ncbi:MAG: amidohydrolase family protein, partial [Planctomycetota bacterium]
HGVYDSYWIKQALARTGVPMNLGPRQFEFEDGKFMANAAELHGAGVPVSICTDAPVVRQDQLPLQAAMAARLGLPTEAALRGLTIEPARAIGLGDRLGSIKAGKDADLVAFPGDPLDPRNLPTLVLINGKIVVDRRQAKQR